jgi:hypothetical protein
MIRDHAASLLGGNTRIWDGFRTDQPPSCARSANNGHSRRSSCVLASLDLATRDARTVTDDSTYRLQQTCERSAGRGVGLVFVRSQFGEGVRRDGEAHARRSAARLFRRHPRRDDLSELHPSHASVVLPRRASSLRGSAKVLKFGAPDRIQTCDLCLRRQKTQPFRNFLAATRIRHLLPPYENRGQLRHHGLPDRFRKCTTTKWPMPMHRETKKAPVSQTGALGR